MGLSANGGEYRPTTDDPELGRVDETVECVSCGARWTNRTGEPLRACPSCGRSGPMRLVRLDVYESLPPAGPARSTLGELVTALDEQTRRLRSMHEDGWEIEHDAGDGVVHVVKRYGPDDDEVCRPSR